MPTVRITLKKGSDETVFAKDAPAPSTQVGDAAHRAAQRGGGRAKAKPARRARPRVEEEAGSAPPPPAPEAPPQEPKTTPAPRPVNPEDHGVAFVRMLNRHSVVVPVPATDVPARLKFGFQFIYGEPAVPRVHGNPDRCDKYGPGWVAFPRPGFAGVKTLAEAAQLWIKAMMDDRAEGNCPKEVDWGWLDVAGPAMLQKIATLEHKPKVHH